MTTDKSDMRQVILDFPSQFLTGYAEAGIAGKKFEKKRFGNIVIAGMGGSALPGELLKAIAQEIKLDLPVHIHRGYGLPSSAYLNKKSLLVVISYSGNTEETLSVYREAKKTNIPMMAIASGGELEVLATQDKTPFALIPAGIQPRIGIGYQFAALLAILANAGVIPSQLRALTELNALLKPETLEKEAKALAKKLHGTTPLIYASERYRALAYILKIQMNENGKLHAFYNIIPEMNHNEMVGFTKKSNFSVVMLRAKDDHPRIQKRVELMTRLVEKRGFAVYPIDINGKKVYDRLFNTILLGNWLSYYLALNRNIDPTPVDIIEDFKEHLK